jgi:hypothetical protein
MRQSLEKRLTDNGFALLSSLGQWTSKKSIPRTRSLTVKPGSSQQKSLSLEIIYVHLCASVASSLFSLFFCSRGGSAVHFCLIRWEDVSGNTLPPNRGT